MLKAKTEASFETSVDIYINLNFETYTIGGGTAANKAANSAC